MDFHILSMTNPPTNLNSEIPPKYRHKKEALHSCFFFNYGFDTEAAKQKNEQLTALIDDLTLEVPHSLAHYFSPIKKWHRLTG